MLELVSTLIELDPTSVYISGGETQIPVLNGLIVLRVDWWSGVYGVSTTAASNGKTRAALATAWRRQLQ